jgi:lipoprotein-anchoring transpeptidase ErfK/SrfK
MRSKPNPFHITRRDFLKHSLFGLASLAMPIAFRPEIFQAASLQDFNTNKGRVLKEEIKLFSEPAFTSRPVGRVGMNRLVDLLEAITGQADEHGNDSWYRIASHLFLHASGIQPVENRLNPAETDISHYGRLAMVSVPILQAWKAPFGGKKEFITLYYGSNHWITGVRQALDGKYFYKIEEDRWQDIYYVPAEYLHVFTDRELLPITAKAPAASKRLEVDLSRQQVTAYENEIAVFQSRMASGYQDGTKDYSTPPGEYEISLKRPSRHMTHSDRLSDADTDLYGVPWMCNFTETGIAFHGTYWHNEFNHPHSHGCINLPIEAARRVYLWSDPAVPAGERKFVTRFGTKVIVR